MPFRSIAPVGVGAARSGSPIVPVVRCRCAVRVTVLVAVLVTVALAVGTVESADAATFESVSAGTSHTCAVKTDASIACWGYNGVEETAAAVGSFASVSASWTHTCGVKTDASIACWGLGVGVGQGPATVAGSFASVSAGGRHTCAVGMDASIACWGDNSSGQAPTTVAGSFASVSAGGRHTCAVKTDASIACWGDDYAGRAPATVAGSFASVSAGGGHTCAVKTDASIICWGDNRFGQSFDVTAPRLSLTWPAHASVTADRTPALSGVAGTDHNDLWGVTIDVYAGTDLTGAPTQTKTTTGDPYNGYYSVDTDALTDGVYTARAAQSDSASNTAHSTNTFRVDTSAPVTSDDVPVGVVNHPVTVTLRAADADGSGIGQTFYSTGSNPAGKLWATYDPAAKPVLQNGERIRYFSTDFAGNAEVAHSSAVAVIQAALPVAVTATFTPTRPRRPTVTHLRIAPRTFTIPTIVRYNLNIAASVRFTFTRDRPGRTVTGHCITPKRATVSSRACTRNIPVKGHVTRARRAGSDRFTLPTRLAGRTLARGLYRLRRSRAPAGRPARPPTHTSGSCADSTPHNGRQANFGGVCHSCGLLGRDRRESPFSGERSRGWTICDRRPDRLAVRGGCALDPGRLRRAVADVGRRLGCASAGGRRAGLARLSEAGCAGRLVSARLTRRVRVGRRPAAPGLAQG